MKRRAAFVFALACFSALATPGHSRPELTTPDRDRLRCEYRADPLGIESPRPRLSWCVPSPIRGQQQLAYQILVASTPELLARDRGDLWDSGKVDSADSVLIPYGGKRPAALQQVWWKRRVWLAMSNRNPSVWSTAATWTMGLKPEEWKAQWITLNYPEGSTSSTSSMPPLPIFRKAFTPARPVKRAIVCVCGLGQYELSINGQRVGDNQIDPGWTNYRKRCLYVMYDVTGALRAGENAIGVMLGNGMYNVTGGRYKKFLGSFGPPKLILQMRIEYRDGGSEIIVSDTTWKATAGPIRFSCIYGGEDTDARAEQANWDAPGFNDAAWTAAAVTTGPGGRLEAQAHPPTKIKMELPAVQKTEPRPGAFVHDLGRNFSGWPGLRVKGPAGSSVKLIPGELLDQNGLVTQRSSGGPVYFTYTLKGGSAGEEEWHPRFSYYGFRYAQVETQPAPGQSALPEVLSVGGQFLTAATPAGSFECSNPRINAIHKLITAAIECNLQSVLTDCPHREKLGWLEVSHLLGRSIMFNYDVPNFYAKICQDMAEAQLENGLVPDIAPEFTVFNGGFRDSPEWGSAAVIDPWLVYQMYGDAALLEKHYGTMARYVDYLGTKAKDRIVSYGLGDWYDIGPKGPGVSQLTSLGVTATGVWYQDVKIMAQAAALLGKADEAKKYQELVGKIREAFNRAFFHPGTGSYDRDSQTANAMALTLGLVPQDRRATVAERLAAGIRANGNRVTAGDVGFQYLVEALAATGHDDVLYDMVTQDAGPGYVYQLNKGATTLTEAWDTNPASSQNHCMLGHVEEWFYTGLGGISPMAPGFRKIRIRPALVGDLTWVTAIHESVRGRIVCSWRKENGRLKMNVEIPVGAEGEIYVPARRVEDVTENGQPAARAAGVKSASMVEGAAVFTVDSGGYAFEVDF